MQLGKFIVIEGMEGAGKSSAINIVKDTLEQFNIEYICTREPGGTPLAESLRNMVKSVDLTEKLTQETELFLMYASRSQLLANKIMPALQKGLWVIGDRHDLSSRAYQGGGRGFDDQVMDSIAQITLKGFEPDLTLYLDVEPTIGLARAKARGDLDRIELEKIDFFNRVRNKYIEIANNNNKIITIDSTQPMNDVHSDVKDSLNSFIHKQENRSEL
ncbi:MAG: dTMP kinase [Colwellia sp.]